MPSLTNSMGSEGGLRITVRLHANLRHRGSEVIDWLELEIPEASAVRDVLSRLEIPEGVGLILVLNGQVVEPETEIVDGDRLQLIPALSGGGCVPAGSQEAQTCYLQSPADGNIKTRAAVLGNAEAPFLIEEIEISALGRNEVQVELKATDVCHTDLHAAWGHFPVDKPMVLGHKGAGIVQEVGRGLAKVAVGDHVALASTPICGDCDRCVAG